MRYRYIGVGIRTRGSELKNKAQQRISIRIDKQNSIRNAQQKLRKCENRITIKKLKIFIKRIKEEQID